MPRRGGRGGRRGGRGGKKSAKALKRKREEWYYDGPKPIVEDTDLGLVNKGHNSDACQTGNVVEASSGIESDSSSEETAYSRLVKSATSQSSEYQKIMKQRHLEEEGRSSGEEEDENEEEAHPFQHDDDNKSGISDAEEDPGAASDASSSSDLSLDKDVDEDLSASDGFRNRFLKCPYTDRDYQELVSRKGKAKEIKGVLLEKGGQESLHYSCCGGPLAPMNKSMVRGYFMKPRLAKQWLQSSVTRNYAGQTLAAKDSNTGFTALQGRLFPILNSYRDLLFAARRTESSYPSELRDVINLHLVNHVMKARDIVVKNHNKIKQAGIASKQKRDCSQVQASVDGPAPLTSFAAQEKERKQKSKEKKRRRLAAAMTLNVNVAPKSIPTTLNGHESPEDVSGSLGNLKDQGFTRPRILVLLPVRSAAEAFVNSLLSVLPSSISSVTNKRKFELEFGLTQEEDELDDLGRRKTEFSRDGKRRPEEWIELFAKNHDDFFRIGISLDKKTCKLFSDFYSSDIIVASPLGLRLLTGVDGERHKETDFDFLSSIEIIVMDQASAILMQNWRHAQDVVRKVNCMPMDQHDTDFSRVMPQFLNGHSRHLRQTIVCASCMDPRLNALIGKECANISGYVKVRQAYDGEISEVSTFTKHLFRRVECDGLQTVDDARLEYFTKHIFPRLRRICDGLDADEEAYMPTQKNSGTLLFVPSYFDFVRLKQLFHGENLDPALISEYTDAPDVTRARGAFFHGKLRVLICTERYHFYNRHKLRGIKHLLFYAPPINAHLYADLCNLVFHTAGDTTQVSTLFTKFDTFPLERVVGTTRFKRLIKEKAQDTFLFQFN
jgi:U3 small nucleolar RNA-associated protein 25